MFQHTQPAPIDALDGQGLNPWAEFRVDAPRERLALLRQLRDGSYPVHLSAPDGTALTTSLWAVDEGTQRLAFGANTALPQLENLVDADEAVAVAYLDSVKLQFDVHGMLLVHSPRASVLQAAMPAMIYRFQRREAFRVRPPGKQVPVAQMRHPSMPEMTLSLRVIDVSVGGCALQLPHDVPGLQAGTTFGEVRFELDADTRFSARLTLHHVTAIGTGGDGERGDGGVRLGCSWSPLDANASRSLQRWIDQTQKRRRLLSLR